MQFGDKCQKLMEDLPEETRKKVFEKNLRNFKPLKVTNHEHPLLEQCFLLTGHNDHDFYSEKVNKTLWEIEELREIFQLFRQIPCRWLKFVLDFKHGFVGFLDSRSLWLFDYAGVYYNLRIYVGSKFKAGSPKDFRGTLVHEMTHFVMGLVNSNGSDPYRSDDMARRQEFIEAIAECKDVYEKKEKGILLIDVVFQTYQEESYASELIARAPQLLVEFSENDAKIVITLYPKLYAYFFKYFANDIEEYRQRSLEDIKRFVK